MPPFLRTSSYANVHTTTKELVQYIIMHFAYKTISVVETMYFINNSILNHHTLQWGYTGKVLVHRQVLTLSWGLNHHYYCISNYCTCMHALKKGRRLENEKFFELKSREYRDGIKRLHNITELLSLQCLQVDDVIPILLPC